jgi:hypothetical protein
VSFRALKDRMMYGLDDDSVDVFSFLIFLFWGMEILVLDFRALGRQERRWEVLAGHATSRLALEFGICDFLFHVLLFVSSASGMICGSMGRPGAAPLRSFFSCFFYLFFLSLSFFLVLIFFTGRRQTGLAVNYYLD